MRAVSLHGCAVITACCVLLAAGCSGQTAATSPSAGPTHDTGYRGDQQKPDWLRFQLGARGFLTDSGHAVRDHDNEQHPSVDLCYQKPRKCGTEHAGQIVVITSLHPRIQPGDPGSSDDVPILVAAPKWSAVIPARDLIPVIPQGTVITCAGDGAIGLAPAPLAAPQSVKTPATLRVTTAESAATVGFIRAAVTSGASSGKTGFAELSSDEMRNCTAAGAPLGFDTDDLEATATP